MINKCSNCGALISSPYDFVCDYCGHIFVENIKSTDDYKNNAITFEQSMDIIQNNLNALQEMPKPTFGKALLSVLRVLIAIYTFGIILIFWKRSKKRFDKENYRKLKAAVHRNIIFLKLSSAGSKDLLNRINVVEDELADIDKKIKNGNILKLAVYTLVIVLFAIRILTYEKQNIVYKEYKVFPYDTLVSGNLRDYIVTVDDSFTVKRTESTIDNNVWVLKIKLKTKLKKEIKSTSKFAVEIVLTDKKGTPVEGLYKGKLDYSDELKLINALKLNNTNADWYTFRFQNQFNFNKYKNELPKEISNFSVETYVNE